MSWIRSVSSGFVALLLITAGSGRAQDTPLDPRSSVAINLPPDRVKELAPTLLPDKNADIVVYCAKPS